MTDNTSSTQKLPKLPKYAWVFAPIIAFAGIATGIIMNMSAIGLWGCLVSSFLLGGIAYLKPKKDLVSLLVPLFAIIIFNPWGEFTTGPIMQILFAATITVIAVRLEKRYSQ